MSSRITDELAEILRGEAEMVLDRAGELRAEIQPLLERAVPLTAKLVAGKLAGQDTRELEADLRAIALNIAAKGGIAANREYRLRVENIIQRVAAVVVAALA